MILQLDIGNSRLKWRTLFNGSVVGRGACVLDDFDIDQLGIGAELKSVQLAAVGAKHGVDRVVASIRSAFPLVSVYQAEPSASLGSVRFSYERPETQGVDRCLAMLGAYERLLDKPGFNGLMVLDAGSAITVDVLDAAGNQIEGYILPGLSMMREALLGKTSNISSGYSGSESGSTALSTRQCVDRGVQRAFFSSVKGFINDAELRGLDLIITGGDARAIERAFPSAGLCVVDELVFEGLAMSAEWAGA